MKYEDTPQSSSIKISLENLNGFTRAFAREVKAKRQQLGMSQEQLATMLQNLGLNASQSYISRLESGHREEPSTQLVVTIAALLEISIDRIIVHLMENVNAQNRQSNRTKR